MAGGEISTWSEAVAAIRAALEKQRGKRGSGLRLLTGEISSPTLAAQIDGLLKDFRSARWHQYEPAAGDSARQGAELAFARPVSALYHFDRADVVLSLDADFLGLEGNPRYVREFIDRRRISVSEADAKQAKMNRLYVAECTPSVTGAKADHRWAMRAADVERFARSVAGELDSKFESLAGNVRPPIPADSIAALVRDLQRSGAASLVIAGDRQPLAVHALAHAMNAALKSAGNTVTYIDPIAPRPADQNSQMTSLADLVRDMAAGEVELLLVLGVNAIYSAPSDLDFTAALAKVPLSIHQGLYRDETARLCTWHLPEAHFLESWSDARAFDGTDSIVQPLIAPLYDSRTKHELLQLFSSPSDRASYEIVRDTWRRHWEDANRSDDFETFWETAVHDGIVPNTALPERMVSLEDGLSRRLSLNEAGQARDKGSPEGGDSNYEIIFAPDPTIYDGRFANNGWLQELPKPLTKLTWGNAALVSPATAKRIGLSETPTGHGGEHGDVAADVIELNYGGRSLRAPAWIMPGQPDDSITVHLGYGRVHAGRIGDGVGFNANRLRTSKAPWFADGLQIRKTDDKVSLACTQYHHWMQGRNLVRSTTLNHFHDDPTFAKKMTTSGEPEEHDHPPTSLYPTSEHKYEGHKWGMAIDLTACIGCNACVVAYQAENNIPVVGKEQVARGREMHWIRIDRYYGSASDNPSGKLANPDFHFQPVPCMQCENAPCELVCPVEATVHSDEGLNDMVYNRCVGTRYCSNNCPYKVRRFNFLQYSDFTTPQLMLLHNPEVTVRSRGVMEKCTYCVQRITRGRIAAEREDRHLRDGDIVTACQAACPARAISFGDLNDSKSEVADWKLRPLEYALLGELDTRPRTTYLAEVRNPDREIVVKK